MLDELLALVKSGAQIVANAPGGVGDEAGDEPRHLPLQPMLGMAVDGGVESVVWDGGEVAGISEWAGGDELG